MRVALRAGVERVFGRQAEVQRCQIHKRRNVTEHLPEHCRADWNRRLGQAYAPPSHEEAKGGLQRLWRQLCEVNLARSQRS